MSHYSAWKLSQTVLACLKIWCLRTGPEGSACIALAVICCGWKKNQNCRTRECITVINCGLKKVRDILDTEEIKWKVVLTLCGMELQRVLFAGWKLIIGFCLKQSLCKRHVCLPNFATSTLCFSAHQRGTRDIQAISVGLAC